MFIIFIMDINRNKARDKLQLLVYFTLIIEVILMLFAVNRPDYIAYKQEFDFRRGLSFSETGIKIISIFLERIRLHYFWIFQILIVILILYIFTKWKKYSENLDIVLLLYSQFIMYYDVIQIRNTIASFLILLSLFYGIDGKIIKCLLSVVAALFFHKFALLTGALSIYVCIYAQKNVNLPHVREIINSFIIAIVIGVFGRTVTYVFAGIPFVGRINAYITNSLSIDSLVIWAGYGVCLLISVWALGIKQSCINAKKNGNIKKVIALNTLFKFSTFSIVFSSFLLFINEFNRLYRLFYLVLYIIIGMVYYDIEKKNRFILLSTVFLLNIIFMIVAMKRGINFDQYW